LLQSAREQTATAEIIAAEKLLEAAQLEAAMAQQQKRKWKDSIVEVSGFDC
jgi:hypothetical protein